MVKLKEDRLIQKAFKDISDSSWDKIIIRCSISEISSGNGAGCLNLTNFFNTMTRNNPKFFEPKGNGAYSFPNDEVFKDVLNIFPKAKLHFKSRDTSIAFNTRNPADEGKEGPIAAVHFSMLLANDGDASLWPDERWRKGNDLFANVIYKTVSVGSNGRIFSLYCTIRSLEIFKFLKKYSNDTTIPIVYQAGIDFDEKEFAGVEEVKPFIVPSEPVVEPTPTPPVTTTIPDQLTNLNNSWKKMITDNFSGASWTNLEKRWKEQKDAILNDPFFATVKNYNEEQKKQMLQSIVRMYSDGDVNTANTMSYAVNSIKENGNYVFICYEYLSNFMNLMAGKTVQTNDGDKEKLKQSFPDLFDSEGKVSDSKIQEIKNLQTNQEKHTDKDLEKHAEADLKPTDLPNDWKEQIAQAKEWAEAFAGKSAEEVKGDIDSLNSDLKNLQDQLEALQEGDDSTRALFEVPPKS